LAHDIESICNKFNMEVSMRVKTATVALLLGALAISACAKKSDNIEPAAISTSGYDGWNCTKLAREKAFVDNALVRVSAQQDKAASNDAVMVFLIGVPTSGGGVPGEVARLKGEQEALRITMRDRGCR
jgi:hypothetical protein